MPFEYGGLPVLNIKIQDPSPMTLTATTILESPHLPGELASQFRESLKGLKE
jgi:hypothetical protein